MTLKEFFLITAIYILRPFWPICIILHEENEALVMNTPTSIWLDKTGSQACGSFHVEKRLIQGLTFASPTDRVGPCVSLRSVGFLQMQI